MEKKHHYRNVMKSDHLSSADLEDLIEQGKKLIFTIKNVKQEIGVSVAGKKGDFNIAYFIEPIKPLVLNATNCKMLRVFANGSPMVEDWNNILVELYIDANVKMKGEKVSGVRISPVQPKLSKPKFTETNFEKAKGANATVEMIKKNYDLDLETEQKYLQYVAKK
jgi:hypothetical protein